MQEFPVFEDDDKGLPGLLYSGICPVTNEAVLFNRERMNTLSRTGAHNHFIYVVFFKNKGIESGDYFMNKALAALHFENITTGPHEPVVSTGGKTLLEMMKHLRQIESKETPLTHRNYKD